MYIMNFTYRYHTYRHTLAHIYMSSFVHVCIRARRSLLHCRTAYCPLLTEQKLNSFPYYMLLAMQFEMAKWFRRWLKYDAEKFSWYLVHGYLIAIVHFEVRQEENEKKKTGEKQWERRCSESFMENRKDSTDKIMR